MISGFISCGSCDSWIVFIGRSKAIHELHEQHEIHEITILFNGLNMVS